MRRLVILSAFAAGLVSAAPAQSRPASSPATLNSQVTLSATDLQRLRDLGALVEGQNSPQARRTGAKEILRLGGPESVREVTAILTGASHAGRIAMALALAELPDYYQSAYADSLLTMLAETDPECSAAAVTALSATMRPELIPRLRALLLDGEVMSARLAAIDVLASMTNREAAEVLIAALANPRSPVCQPALAGLGRATAYDFQGDPAAALSWWESVREYPRERWLQTFTERLEQQNLILTQRLRDAETRLTTVLRENALKANETERQALLKSYLFDTAPLVRGLALELIQAQSADGKTFPPEMAARVRELALAGQADSRAPAIRTLAAVGDPNDTSMLLQMAASETSAAIRQALANALGYLGDGPAVEALTGLLADRDAGTAGEAATALGRLAERNAIDATGREAAAAALLDRWRAGGGAEGALPERLLSAMGRLEDARFLTVFSSVISTGKSAALRLAATRGLAGLAGDVNRDPANSTSVAQTSRGTERQSLRSAIADALGAALTDADVGVRRAALDVFSNVAGSDAHLQQLWARLEPSVEPDDGVRTAVWKGVLRLLAGRKAADIDGWIGRLTDATPLRQQRTLDLLGVEERALVAAGAGRGDIGLLHVRAAALRAELGRPAEAVDTYLQALDDLLIAKSSETRRAALELARVAIFQEKLDPRVGTALAMPAVGLNAAALWEALRSDIDLRLKPENVDSAVAAIRNLLNGPLLPLDAATFRQVDEYQHRVLELRAGYDSERVNAALVKLWAAPTDDTARAAILQLGERAAPVLRAALRELLRAGPNDAKREKLVYELLKLVTPDWSGYGEDATLQEKLQSLDAPRA